MFSTQCYKLYGNLVKYLFASLYFLSNVEKCVLIAKKYIPFTKFIHAEEIKSLLFEKKNLSNCYANTCFLWARKLFNFSA